VKIEERKKNPKPTLDLSSLSVLSLDPLRSCEDVDALALSEYEEVINVVGLGSIASLSVVSRRRSTRRARPEDARIYLFKPAPV